MEKNMNTDEFQEPFGKLNKQPTVSESDLKTFVRRDSNAHKGINHGSTVVVCNNRYEFEFMTAWCEDNDKNTPYLDKPKRYPFCIGTKDGAWTDLMDRALYYKPFTEFLVDIESA